MLKKIYSYILYLYQMNYDCLIKIIIIGDSGVGKSSLLRSYCDQSFDKNFYSTIGIDFKIKNTNINNKNIRLQIWDTAGQERFRSINTSYYRGADIILLVFDLTKRSSFDNLNKWKLEIEKVLVERNYKLIIIGNKSDIENQTVIGENEIKSYIQSMNCIYFETSSKNYDQVEKIFEKILKSSNLLNKEEFQNNLINIEENKLKKKCCKQ